VGTYFDSARIDKIASEVLFLTNRGNQNRISDDVILRWINLCEADLASRHAFGPKSDTLDLVADTAQYDLTSAFSDYEALWLVQVKQSDDEWQQIPKWEDPNQFMAYRRHVGSADRPLVWYHHGKLLDFAPTPASSFADSDAIVKVHYFYRPSAHDGSSDDVPALTEAHDDVYVLYCLLRYALREGFTGSRGDVIRDVEQRYFNARGLALHDLKKSQQLFAG
jgi:hypothetical protein